MKKQKKATNSKAPKKGVKKVSKDELKKLRGGYVWNDSGVPIESVINR